MSDLLERLKLRRDERIKIKAAPIDCADGYFWDDNAGKCMPLPGTTTPTTDPTTTPSAPVPASEPIAPNLAHINVQNIMRLKVQMGNEYGADPQWYSVLFPQDMLSAHVTAVSGPRSAKSPRADIVADRRAEFLTKVAGATSLAVRNSIEDAGLGWVMDIWDGIFGWYYNYKGGWTKVLFELLTGAPIDPPPAVEVFVKMFSGVLTSYSELLWDYIVKPTWQEFDNVTLENVSMWGIAEAWGIERGRSVHNVTLRNITGSGFEWYSYGDMYINWVGIGLLRDPQELPPEIQQPIDTVKQELADLKIEYNEEIQALKTQIQDLLAQFGSETPATARKRILPRF